MSVRRNARTHYLLREDLLKLDKYLAENNLLISRDIKDADTLDKAKQSEVMKLEEMHSARNKLRNKIRRANDDARPELLQKLSEMNRAIKEQRKTVFYLKDIEKTVPELEKKLSKAKEVSKETSNNKTYSHSIGR